MIPPADEADRIRFNGSLRPLDSRLDLPDEIDYNAPYRVMGVVAECFIHPDSICYVTPEPGIVSSIRRYRRDVQARIAVLPLSSGAREFLMAETRCGPKTAGVNADNQHPRPIVLPVLLDNTGE